MVQTDSPHATCIYTLTQLPQVTLSGFVHKPLHMNFIEPIKAGITVFLFDQLSSNLI